MHNLPVLARAGALPLLDPPGRCGATWPWRLREVRSATGHVTAHVERRRPPSRRRRRQFPTRPGPQPGRQPARRRLSGSGVPITAEGWHRDARDQPSGNAVLRSGVSGREPERPASSRPSSTKPSQRGPLPPTSHPDGQPAGARQPEHQRGACVSFLGRAHGRSAQRQSNSSQAPAGSLADRLTPANALMAAVALAASTSRVAAGAGPPLA